MNNIRKCRLSAKLTQKELAKIIKTTLRNYQYLEYGKRLPRVDRALTLAKALNTTVEELFGKDK